MLVLNNAAELIADIERRIASGELPPGGRLLPVRAAATEFGLAPNTVANAYRQLQQRGIVFSDGRRGTFVAERSLLAPSEQPVPDDLIDLASGNPDVRLLPDLAPVLSAIAHDHVLYGTEPIDPELSVQLIADMRPDLKSLTPDGISPGQNLVVTSGALDGIERALTARLRPGDRVAVEDPTYTSVTDLLAALNLRTIPMAMDRFGVTPDELSRALAAGADAVLLTPRAHNPTGAAFDEQRAEDLRAVLNDRGEVLIIEDDYAGKIAGQRYHTAVPNAARSWVVIRSLSKSLGPDLRVAGVVGDPITVARIASRQLLGAGWVSHLLQRSAAMLLNSRSTNDLLVTAAATYTERRQAFVDRLGQSAIAAGGRSGLNVWVPVADEAAVVAGMQQRGFAIRSGARFRTSAAAAVRISTAAADVPVLIEAADALSEIVGGRPRSRSV